MPYLTRIVRHLPDNFLTTALGLKNFTLATVGAAGAIRYVKGRLGECPMSLSSGPVCGVIGSRGELLRIYTFERSRPG